MKKALKKKFADVLGASKVPPGISPLISYSYDSQQFNSMPDLVVNAETRDDVVKTLILASSYRLPVVPRGAGSGMSGGSVPEKGGIVLNMERMNKIISFSVEDRLCVAQPGVITADIQRLAEKNGLFYPPEPASAKFSSIGGNVAESAGGLGCVKYGLTKDFIAGLEFVTASGEIVRTGVLSDSEAPFDAGAALIGSEGTLAVVTEVAVRLIPLPPERVTVLAVFKSLPEAAVASNAVLSSGADPSVLEFMDKKCIETVREYAGVEVHPDAGALLLVELDGDSSTLAEGRKILMDTLSALYPIELKSAEKPSERKALWKLRESLSPAIAKIAPLKFNEDVCVPLSKIPTFCAWVEELGKRRNVRVVTFGHSGDGNIHVNFMTHWERPEEVARVHEAVSELFVEVIRQGGTLSGEHGIGLSKRPYINLALSPDTIDYEKKIKRAFDPENLLNPGKIFPE